MNVMLNIAIKIVIFLFLFVGLANAQNTWPRDRYIGPGGGLYIGPGGGLYTGPGGGLYTGPGGGLYIGPGGGLYIGPGGGLYIGASENPYKSNQPPREYLLKYLRKNHMKSILELLESVGF